MYDPAESVHGTLYAGLAGKRLRRASSCIHLSVVVRLSRPTTSSQGLFAVDLFPPRAGFVVPSRSCIFVLPSFDRCGLTSLQTLHHVTYMYCWQLWLSHGAMAGSWWVDIDAAVTQSRASEPPQHLPPSVPLDPPLLRGPCSLAGGDEMRICLPASRDSPQLPTTP